jgi:hypothetical protein
MVETAHMSRDVDIATRLGGRVMTTAVGRRKKWILGGSARRILEWPRQEP